MGKLNPSCGKVSEWEIVDKPLSSSGEEDEEEEDDDDGGDDDDDDEQEALGL